MPVVAGISPETSISKVLLPQPLGPTMDDELAGGDREVDLVERVDASPLAAS